MVDPEIAMRLPRVKSPSQISKFCVIEPTRLSCAPFNSGPQSLNLSKVGAAARNARCEADNFNSDRPEGSRRGAVVTPEVRETPLQIDISKCAFASSADILQCVFNVRNVRQKPTRCLSFYLRQRLPEFARTIDEKLRDGAERAILQRDNSVWHAGYR